MDHGLHVLVRFDIDQISTRIEVSGCVTAAGWESLYRVIDRTCSMTVGLSSVIVDLSPAGHIETQALERLQQFCAERSPDESGQAADEVSVIAPSVLPECFSTDPASFVTAA